MKTYIKPAMVVIDIQTTQMIAASGDTKSVGISDTEYSGTFNGREDFFDDDDE